MCWCHAAQDVRTFWAHQIREVFCVVTGEVHEDAVAFFSQHPMLVEPRDPEGYALKVCQHEVNLLTIVGAADGAFDPDEQDRVLMHVFDRMPDLRLDEDVLRHRLALLRALAASLAGHIGTEEARDLHNRSCCNGRCSPWPKC